MVPAHQRLSPSFNVKEARWAHPSPQLCRLVHQWQRTDEDADIQGRWLCHEPTPGELSLVPAANSHYHRILQQRCLGAAVTQCAECHQWEQDGAWGPADAFCLYGTAQWDGGERCALASPLPDAVPVQLAAGRPLQVTHTARGNSWGVWQEFWSVLSGAF